MEENANKLNFYRIYLFIHPQISIFSVFKIVCFLIMITNKIFHVTVLLPFTSAINLWHRKIVTADITAVFVNNQHGIQRQGQDFDKTLKYTQYTQLYAYRN